MVCSTVKESYCGAKDGRSQFPAVRPIYFEGLEDSQSTFLGCGCIAKTGSSNMLTLTTACGQFLMSCTL